MQINQKYIEVQGKKLWTKTFSPKGSSHNPVIVLLHDALGSIEQWKNYPEKLAYSTGCSVFTYDRFGHGRSELDQKTYNAEYFVTEGLETLPEVLLTMNIKEPILYGHSDGGTISILYSANLACKALILESTHVLSEKETRAGVIKMGKQRDRIIESLSKYHPGRAMMLYDRWYTLWSGSQMIKWNIEDALKQIKCPALIMQGGADNYATDEHAHKISNGIGGASSLIFFENCGHHPHKEVPDKMLSEIRKFIIHTLN